MKKLLLSVLLMGTVSSMFAMTTQEKAEYIKLQEKINKNTATKQEQERYWNLYNKDVSSIKLEDDMY
jgi:hypothetical protein